MAAAGGAGQGGMGFGLLQGDLLNTAANYFGITADVLKQELQDKGTLQAVAAAHGKDNDAGKAGLIAALEQSLRTSLTGQGIAADRIEQAVTMLKQNFDRLYTAPLGRIRPGNAGTPGWAEQDARAAQHAPERYPLGSAEGAIRSTNFPAHFKSR